MQSIQELSGEHSEEVIQNRSIVFKDAKYETEFSFRFAGADSDSEFTFI